MDKGAFETITDGIYENAMDAARGAIICIFVAVYSGYADRRKEVIGVDCIDAVQKLLDDLAYGIVEIKKNSNELEELLKTNEDMQKAKQLLLQFCNDMDKEE